MSVRCAHPCLAAACRRLSCDSCFNLTSAGVFGSVGAPANALPCGISRSLLRRYLSAPPLSLRPCDWLCERAPNSMGDHGINRPRIRPPHVGDRLGAGNRPCLGRPVLVERKDRRVHLGEPRSRCWYISLSVSLCLSLSHATFITNVITFPIHEVHLIGAAGMRRQMEQDWTVLLKFPLTFGASNQTQTAPAAAPAAAPARPAASSPSLSSPGGAPVTGSTDSQVSHLFGLPFQILGGTDA